MNIWLVNPFDPLPGEQLRAGRYAFFAKLLGEAGYNVTWWTSAFSHATKSYRNPVTWARHLTDGFAVTALPAPAYYSNVSIRRLVNHFVWARNFYRAARAIDVFPDVIVSSSPPLFATNRALRIARQQGSKVIIDVQDLWPEAFAVIFPARVRRLGMALLQPWKALEDANFRHADGLIAISETLLNRALAVNTVVKARGVIPLGVDGEIYEQATRDGKEFRRKPAGEFWVVYIGTIGRTYDIDTILQTARILKKEEPRIKFFIAGRGPLLQASKDKSVQWELPNVVFTGFLSLNALAQLLAQADVGLNALAAGAVSAFPNKIFDYLAAGLPVVSSVKGELEEFIHKQGLGVSYEAGKPDSLRKALLKLHTSPEIGVEMGMRGHKLVKERFDRQIAYRYLLKLIKDVCE